MPETQISNLNVDDEKLYSLATKRAFNRFSLAEIQLATQHFNKKLIIGKGGFGMVYRGRIYSTRDATARTVAIKRSNSSSSQGAAEFMTEIEMLIKLRHSNLVSLIGYCSENNEMILVYEYMFNGTIDHHLHGAHTPLSWMHRLRISIGVAKGLQYLHTGWHPQQGIIHRDVKSSNILLDMNWVAKVSDFGMSKIIGQLSSGVTTNLKGTFGYLDPEYCSTGWAKKCIKEGRIDQVVSSHIRTQISPKSLKEFVQIADRCSKSSRKDRPTMADVLAALQQSMVLQEQYDSSSRAAGSMGFPHKIQNLLFGSRPNPVSPPKLYRIGSVHLTMNELERATQNFSPSLKIGEGGFGTVYKAQLPDGQLVAIKRAKKVQKEHSDALESEFRSETELLPITDHLNLVKLLGCIDEEHERLIITEYVPNGTLREHLDGVHGSFLDFSQRLEIFIDIAHGLAYLHHNAEKQIIHRHVKSSNIFLTESFRAKLGDFGFAILGDAYKAYVETKVKGTFGYLDPEYRKAYQHTPKSDVYSFGVLLIEILTGRRAVELKRSVEEKLTIRWAYEKYSKGETMDLVDPQLMTEALLDSEIIGKMFKLAFQCAASKRVDRPYMKAVVEQLWVIKMDYLRNGSRG
ncbi:putative protein kinase RLK-Pelle-RLCK-IV family [Helianthus debilis subsp. tardiflorus]